MDNGYCERFKTRLIKNDEVIMETYTEEQLKILLKKPNVRDTSFA
jgi:integrase/recombinase XerD